MQTHRGKITHMGKGWVSHRTVGDRTNITHIASGSNPSARIFNSETGEESSMLFKQGGLLQDLDGIVSYVGEDVEAVLPIAEELAPLVALL